MVENPHPLKFSSCDLFSEALAKEEGGRQRKAPGEGERRMQTVEGKKNSNFYENPRQKKEVVIETYKQKEHPNALPF